MSAIEVTGLRKRYRRLLRPPVDALRGVDLSVPEGSAFGLIGPNGAGKTTFIKSLLGIIQPTDGTVRVLGGSPLDAHVRARIGYLPERLHLPHTCSALGFLDMMARFKDLVPDARAHGQLLERVGLAAAARQRIGEFSKGMRQRLGRPPRCWATPSCSSSTSPRMESIPWAGWRCGASSRRRYGAGPRSSSTRTCSRRPSGCATGWPSSRGPVVRQGRLEELLRGGVRWTVRFAPGVDAGALAAAGFLPGDTEGLYHLEAPGLPELNAALDRARASGALMMELRREGKDLEQVLLSTVEVAA
ncbi:ATP-binding cassette domain-containing protein [Cystobacter fuscus]